MLYEQTVANLEKLTSEIGKKVSLLHDLLQQRNLIHNNSSNMQPLASNINILTSQISAVKKDLAQHEKNLRSLQNGFIVSADEEETIVDKEGNVWSVDEYGTKQYEVDYMMPYI